MTLIGRTARIRDAASADLPAIQGIYSHHVTHGTASFEEVAPDLAEMMRRYEEIVSRGLPFVVAEGGGRVVGYAYAAPYRQRTAYRFTLEDSVYVAPDSMRGGVGRAALTEVIDRASALGYRQMIAVIGDSANNPSVRLHEALGFVPVGQLRAVGFKFGRWIDSVFMQRPLGAAMAQHLRPEP